MNYWWFCLLQTKPKLKDVSELLVCVGKWLSTFFLEKEKTKPCMFILWLACSFVRYIKPSMSIKCCSNTLREKPCEAAVQCVGVFLVTKVFLSIVFRLEDYVFEALAYVLWAIRCQMHYFFPIVLLGKLKESVKIRSVFHSTNTSLRYAYIFLMVFLIIFFLIS